MKRRRCTQCGREEPTYIYDPHCPADRATDRRWDASPYCNFVDVDQRTIRRLTRAEVLELYNRVLELSPGKATFTKFCGLAFLALTCSTTDDRDEVLKLLEALS